MRAGTLNRRVNIYRRVDGARDSLGHPQRSLEYVTTVWAHVESEDGTETVQDDRTQAVRKLKVTIRYRGNLDATYSLNYGTRWFGVVNVLNKDERNREITLNVHEDSAVLPVLLSGPTSYVAYNNDLDPLTVG